MVERRDVTVHQSSLECNSSNQKGIRLRRNIADVADDLVNVPAVVLDDPCEGVSGALEATDQGVCVGLDESQSIVSCLLSHISSVLDASLDLGERTCI